MNESRHSEAETDYAPLEAQLGHSFSNRALLERALTHPSYSQQPGVSIKNNQRLEFLGDAVLGMILAERLYETLPAEREGVLTQYRSMLAKGEHLAQMARDRGIPVFLRLSDAEVRNNGRDRNSILEDALEAVIGAIYLDSDFPTVREVVLHWYGDIESLLEATLNYHNPKGRLQELVQPSLGNDSIVYELIDEWGPAHLKHFKVAVSIGGKPAGTGEGSSKKEAEEQAARVALKQVDAILEA